MQVRNRGTVGGSLAHADPAADFPAVALALGATLTLHGPTGERALPAAELAVGPFATVLDEGELITEIVVAEPPPGTGSAYVSVEHPASGFALAGAGALVGPDGNSRVALTGLGIAPFVMDGDLRDAEIFGDRFAPEEYRRQLARTVAARALERAETRAKEDMRWTA
jgi:carbon-monoxide dehydrogenase medium subunit